MSNAINFSFASETSQLPYPANSTVESAVIAVFLCPSDGQQRVDPINWGGDELRVEFAEPGTINSGNFNIVAGAQLPDGPFYNTSAIRFAQITDGLSNTTGYSETIMGNNITTTRGVRRRPTRGGSSRSSTRRPSRRSSPATVPAAEHVPSGLFHTRLRGRATGAANGRAEASSWRRITIFTRQTASIPIAPTTAGTPR